MRNNMILKVTGIFIVLILLIIPLQWIKSAVGERNHYRQQVVSFVTKKWSDKQALTAPFVVLPFSYQKQQSRHNQKTGKQEKYTVTIEDKLLLTLEKLQANIQLDATVKTRGIYDATVYSAQVELTGEFTNASLIEFMQNSEHQKLKFAQPYLSMAIEDMRGIMDAPSFKLGDKQYLLKAGLSPDKGQGLHSFIAAFDFKKPQSRQFSSSLSLKGSQDFNIYPAGQISNINIESNWQHPSFIGNFLPENSSINQQGFSANWQTSPFSSNINQDLRSCLDSRNCNIDNKRLGVSLITPVDTYAKTTRSLKYGFMFIAITFAAFLLYEVLLRLSIHPLQYAMVGLSLALFFLLLLSMAEHMHFAIAYAIAAFACVGLLTIYLASVLKSLGRALWFACGTLAIYGFIYVIISSEDYALLLGSLLLFAVLATVMIMTKKVNWYDIGNSKNTAPKSADDSAP